MQKHRVLVVGLGSIGRRHVKILGEVADCRIFVLREKAKAKEDVFDIAFFNHRSLNGKMWMQFL